MISAVKYGWGSLADWHSLASMGGRRERPATGDVPATGLSQDPPTDAGQVAQGTQGGAQVAVEVTAADGGTSRSHTVALPNGRTISHSRTYDDATHTWTMTHSKTDAEGDGWVRTTTIGHSDTGVVVTRTRDLIDGATLAGLIDPPPAEDPAEDAEDADDVVADVPLPEAGENDLEPPAETVVVEEPVAEPEAIAA